MFIKLGLLLFYLVDGVFVVGDNITVDPAYAVALIGQNVSFNCSSSSSVQFTWYNDFSTRLRSQGGILVISPVNISYAGKYICQQTVNVVSGAPSSQSTSAQLVVLERELSVSDNASIGAEDGEQVMLSCRISFYGSLKYTISFRDPFGNLLNSTTSETLIALKSEDAQFFIAALNLVVISNSVVDQCYTCEIIFIDTLGETEQIIFYNKSIVHHLNVTFPVRDVRPNTTRIAVGETIECLSEGNPSADINNWTNLNEAEDISHNTAEYFTANGPLLTINKTGSFSFRCTASNIVRNVIHNGSWSGQITVSEASVGNLLRAIIGGSVGGFLLIVIILLVVFIVCRYKQKRKKEIDVLYATPTLGSSTPPVTTFTALETSDYEIVDRPEQPIYSIIETSSTVYTTLEASSQISSDKSHKTDLQSGKSTYCTLVLPLN